MNPLVAAVQLTCTDQVAENLARANDWIRHAKARGASLAVLPENFAFLGQDEQKKFAIAEPPLQKPDGSFAAGPIVSHFQALAQKEAIDLVLGGLPERSATSDSKVYNTCVHINAAGKIGAMYRKIHLFDANFQSGDQYQESRTVQNGTDPVVADSAIGKLGLSICYDLRFPELYRALVAKGARTLLVPAAFTLHTGKDHWHALLRARAIENLAFVIAPAQFGRHNEKRQTYGHSLIIDPWGQILAECGDHEGVALAELDFAWQDSVRKSLPALEHKRL